MTNPGPGGIAAMEGIRVLEIGGERGDYCGRLLAGAGAEVVKVEPPGGSHTRRYGPFYHDALHPERSLYFWHYNLGKRSVTLDLASPAGREHFAALARAADVILDSSMPGTLAAHGFSPDDLERLNARAVVCSITPFGLTGPWRDFEANDLVHLALGGQMMICGYEPPPGDYDPRNPGPYYDTPPIAPQMFHAYHTGGVQAANAIIAALFWREFSGEGQRIDCSVHEALAGCTEAAMPGWLYNQRVFQRQTGRHSGPSIGVKWMDQAADGEYVLAMSPNIGFPKAWGTFVRMLQDEGLGDELADPKYEDLATRRTPEASTRIGEVTTAFVMSHTSEEVMQMGQAAGLAWAPVRRPEQNIDDPQFKARGVFQQVHHPELGESFTYVALPWHAEGMPWRVGRRAPLVGEDTEAVLREWQPGSAG